MGGRFAEDFNLYNATRRRQVLGKPTRDTFRSNRSWAHRYELSSTLKGHQGCVNSVRWSHDAEVLCSGSDDRLVNLWRSHSLKPGGTVAPVASLPTLHTHNIFDAQLTQSKQVVVSCGADGCVCVTDVEAQEHGRRLLFQPESRPFLASKLAFVPLAGPDVFLVTFGDWRVRRFDLREPDHHVAVEAYGAGASVLGLGLTGIEVRPTDGNVLAVGGGDPFVRLYDLRALGSGRERPRDAASSSRGAAGGQTPVLAVFTAQHVLEPVLKRRKFDESYFRVGASETGISGLDWSPDGRMLLANYRNSDVVLYDMSTASPPGGITTAGDVPSSAPCSASAGVDAREGSAVLPDVRDAFHLPTDHVNFTAIRVFEGRVNAQTCAKEVRFLCGDAAVGTGGDDGNFFIWETSSGELLRKLPADRCVVNCVAPHPRQPTVCTSGTDSEIKVWDVGDCRVRGHSRLGMLASATCDAASADWEQRRRDGAPNATAEEADARLKEAEHKKNRGNALVRQADWIAALEQYHAALQELHFLPPNDVMQAALEALVVGCHLNCALCNLSLEEYRLAVESCTRVLEIDSSNVKARFRRATALGEMHEFQDAFEDMDAALAQDPADADLLRLQAKLRKRQRRFQQRERAAYRRIFS